MTHRTRCKWYEDTTAWCMGGTKKHNCPIGFDLNCMVADYRKSPAKPRKAKPRREEDVVKIKAWAEVRGGHIVDVCCKRMPDFNLIMPCTIHIKAKDWKKLKGEKKC